MNRPRPRSQVGLILAAAVIIMAGFGIALVEMFRLPKATHWGVVGVTVLLVAVIRTVSTRKL